MNGEVMEVWRGSVQAWECDHMGHFNTRFYVQKAELALAYLFAELGIDSAKVTVTSQHHRFHREVRAGGPIYATAQVADMGECDAHVMIRILHSASGDLSASFSFRVTGDEPWSAAIRDRAAAITGPLDGAVLPRGLREDEGADPQANRERAIAIGMQATGRTILQSGNCDAQGRLSMSAAMGIIAGSIANMRGSEWREVLRETAPGKPERIGAALVEFSFHHRSWPVLGDCVEVWSGPVDCTDKVTKVAHWLIDPDSGDALASVRAVGVSLDLDARRLIPLTEEAQAAYRREAVSGL